MASAAFTTGIRACSGSGPSILNRTSSGAHATVTAKYALAWSETSTRSPGRSLATRAKWCAALPVANASPPSIRSTKTRRNAISHQITRPFTTSSIDWNLARQLSETVVAESGKAIAHDELGRIVREHLRPKFPALALCRSTPELLDHPSYREIRPLAERVLGTTEIGSFAPSGASRKPCYRLVAWNLERGIQFEGQLDAIRNHPYLSSADVYLVTETDIGMARSGNRNVARELARNFRLDYAFAPCYLNLAKGAGLENEAEGENTVGLHGNAILSRYPIRNARPIHLGNGRDKMRGREKRLGQQAAVVAEIEFPGLDLTVCSVHLDAQSRQRHRRDQMQAIIDGLPGTGPAVIGGDWNTTTFDSSSARAAIIGYWVRVMLGASNTIRNHFLRPYTYFEKELFNLLDERGFDWRGANLLDERTTSYDVEDAKTHKNLREWVPEWCFDFIRWALREFDGKCPLKIDWFAVRGAEAVSPVVLHEFREGRVPPVSDHDAIGIDIPAPAGASL